MKRTLGQIAGLFLKLGCISFGGPAAHVALMEDEAVVRRGWLSRQQFLDLLGATHLIPGPNAVEMAGHIGYRRAGIVGSLVGSLGFSLPAVLITLVFAWAYVHWGSLPQVEPLLAGIKPAVLAVIVLAVFRLGRKALRRWQLAIIGVGVGAASLTGYGQIGPLAVGSLTGVLLLRWTRGPVGPAKGKTAGMLVGVATMGAAGTAQASASTMAGAGVTSAAGGVSLWKLGLFFAKVGAVMYGGGYVLLAYLEGGLVQNHEWLGVGLQQEQLLDAVAIGQLTPGPLLTTVTFVGYLLAGLPGALVATAGILLPSLVLVIVCNPLIPRLRRSPWASRFLDAVNAASVGLMAAVTLVLFRAALIDTSVPWLLDWRGCLIATAAGVATVRWKVTPVWLVLGGAVARRLLVWS